MKGKKIIWSLFDRLRPIIVEKLLNPKDKYVRAGATQLVIPMNAGKNEDTPHEDTLAAIPSDQPNIWYVYPDEPISVSWEGWTTTLIFSLKSDDMRIYRLTVSLSCYGCDDYVGYGLLVTSGTIDQIRQTVNSGKFPGDASGVFIACRDEVARKIEEAEQYKREVKLFADTDITDYDSVMKFMDFINDRNVLKSKGYGMELFAYRRAVCLIDKSSKSVKVLVDRDGKAQFCGLVVFPPELLNKIRLEKKDWDLDVYELKVGQFNANGQAPVTWIISPYYYCPMDDDGFGEEEEYEVAVTCHIDTEGHLADTPVWKPYTGPRR